MLRRIALVMGLVLAVVGGAGAAELEGKIKAVETGDRAIVLEDGTRLWLAEGLPMDNLKEGATVKASYEQRDGRNVATSVTVTD